MDKILDLDKLWHVKLGITGTDYSYVGTQKQFLRWLGAKRGLLPYLKFDDLEQLPIFNKIGAVSLGGNLRAPGSALQEYVWNIETVKDSRWFRSSERYSGRHADNYHMACLKALLCMWEMKQLRKGLSKRLKKVDEENKKPDPNEISLIAQPFPQPKKKAQQKRIRKRESRSSKQTLISRIKPESQ